MKIKKIIILLIIAILIAGFFIFDLHQYLDFSYEREGQDVRYSVDDSKLRNLGWYPKIKFDDSIKHIVEHYKKTFVW